MSERSSHRPEQHKSHEQLVNPEHQQRHQEAAVEKARRALAEHESKNKAELAKEATKHAAEAKKHAPAEQEPKTYHDIPGVQQSMKNRAYKRELSKIQTKLPPASRRFSKIIHNPTVEAISNVGAQTIARPSGLLGGSICAFIGSLILYVMTKQYGFKYNYLMMFLLFVGGFAIGAVIELLGWHVFFRKKHAHRR